MINFERKRYNPIEMIRELYGDVDVSHITFEPSMTNGDYCIVRQMEHDGGVGLRYIAYAALHGLVNMTSCLLDTKPKSTDELVAIKYTVGKVRHSTVYTKIQMGDGMYPGMRERVRIPVRCEYVFKDEPQ